MKESNTSKRLKEIMSERNLRQVDILNAIRKNGHYMSKSALSQYINGKSEPDQEKLSILSDTLGVSETYLMGYQTKNDVNSNNIIKIDKVKLKKVPLLGQISCGKPYFSESNYGEYINVDTETFEADFALKADGWSMVDAGIDDGDIVFFKSTPQVENGSIVAVSIDGEATLKRFVRVDRSQIILQPYNESIAPIILKEEDNKTIRILGEKVALLKIGNK
ncbi:LexA family transcriptional regulator [uncultured Anaerococcus sp.]|uniref:LexA family protein n=1 Tax=uncultured Anaerococcus sp. TaxID=293428 RepID=UPI0025E8BDDE|nr:S24 family peptidase [uncultured Anaerococcus sp.]